MVYKGCKVLIVCGPSGSGKSTLLKRLFDEYPNKFGFSVSHTTRNPRPGEQNGYHYHFTTKEEMEKAISRDEFLESAVFANNMYGTSRAAMQAVCNEGKVCVLDIDVQGVKQIKKKNIDSVYIFIKPPSMEELEKRLKARGTESEDSLKSRLDAARLDMIYGETPGNFNFILVNDSLDKAYPKFKDFIFQELEKCKSNKGRYFFQQSKN